MSTHRRTWKKFEQRFAALFGCRRQVLSGSSGRDDSTASDSTHPALFLEAKLRESHAVRTLHDSTRLLAKKERKTPILGLADKNRPGFLVCVHSDDWETVIVQWCAGLDDQAGERVSTLIRTEYHRLRETGHFSSEPTNEEEDEAA